jgi:RNA polymerase sigma-70 factor (ECF subfamily)
MEKNNEFRTDEQIVKQVLLGRTDSFKIIIERYQKKIFCIGLRFYNNEEDSYDFTQEVFIKAFESLGSYAGRAPFRFWLTKIAYNHAINRINAKRIESEIPEQIQSRDTTPEAEHMRGEICGILHNAVKQLPSQYRICVDLYFFLGLTYNEISEITGYPVNTIKSNVLRAKKMLRDELRGTIAEDYHEL